MMKTSVFVSIDILWRNLMSRVSKFKPGQLTDKDMSVLREGDSARVQHKMNVAVVRDYSLQHEVVVSWDINKDAERDQIFRLEIDNYEVFLDAEEMMRILRWV